MLPHLTRTTVLREQNTYFILFVFAKGLQYVRRIFSSDHKIAFRQRIHNIAIRFPYIDMGEIVQRERHYARKFIFYIIGTFFAKCLFCINSKYCMYSTTKYFFISPAL